LPSNEIAVDAIRQARFPDTLETDAKITLWEECIGPYDLSESKVKMFSLQPTWWSVEDLSRLRVYNATLTLRICEYPQQK
jgi:hypothetical protein